MATIQFSNGQTVEFDGNPTQQDVEEVATRLGINKQPQQTNTPSLTDSATGKLPVIKQATQIGTGIGTAIGKAGLNVGKAVLNVGSSVLDKVSKVPVIGDLASKESALIKNKLNPQIDTLSNNLFQQPFQNELNTTGGKIGQAVGTVAPYVASGGVVSDLANGASKAVTGGGAIARIAAGAGTEALANYGLGYGLSGGDKKQALIAAATAGFLKAGTSAIGEIANATNTPEKLMNNVFRTNKKEALAGFKFNQETLAKQALDRGITGNTEQIANKLITGMTDSEQQIAQEFAQAGNPSIYLDNPKSVIEYITNKANLLEKSGAINEANGLRNSLGAINPETGAITANNALGLRRFLDGLRTEKSYLAPTEELAAQQAGLKEMTEEIRHKINAIGGTGDIMKNYSFYIKAMDELGKYAARSKNADALGLINTFLLGEGIAVHDPVLAGVGIARRLLKTPKMATKLAQFLKNLPKSSAGGSATRSIIGSVLGKQ